MFNTIEETYVNSKNTNANKMSAITSKKSLFLKEKILSKVEAHPKLTLFAIGVLASLTLSIVVGLIDGGHSASAMMCSQRGYVNTVCGINSY